MNGLLTAIAHHGYLLLFAVVLAEACGLPAPAAIALVAAGAAVAAHVLSGPVSFAIAIIGFLMGDLLLFFAGRSSGWALLGVLCRLSANPESCILRSAESFYKHGKITLLFAKFIPGVNSMAPPLAGSMKMKTEQFLRFDFVGTLLYVSCYGGLGFLFHGFVATITNGLQRTGRTLSEIIFLALAAYIVYRIAQYRRFQITDVAPRIAVAELGKRMLDHSREGALIIDVRSHGYYDSGAARIAGSIRLEPNRLPEEIESLPKDKDIYVYCT